MILFKYQLQSLQNVEQQNLKRIYEITNRTVIRCAKFFEYSYTFTYVKSMQSIQNINDNIASRSSAEFAKNLWAMFVKIDFVD